MGRGVWLDMIGGLCGVCVCVDVDLSAGQRQDKHMTSKMLE